MYFKVIAILCFLMKFDLQFSQVAKQQFLGLSLLDG